MLFSLEEKEFTFLACGLRCRKMYGGPLCLIYQAPASEVLSNKLGLNEDLWPGRCC